METDNANLAALFSVFESIHNILYRDGQTDSIWAYSLLNLAGAACIFALTTGRGSRWLERGPASYIGRISFGIYVWHVPLQELSERFVPAEAISTVGLTRSTVHLLATIALAAISYHGFERVFLNLKSRYPRPVVAQVGTNG